MTLLEALRWTGLVIWTLCTMATLSPFFRYLVGKGTGEDNWWSQLWLVSALLTAWSLRSVAMGSALRGDTYTVTCGLLVLQCLVGGSIIRRRINRLGWSW